MHRLIAMVTRPRFNLTAADTDAELDAARARLAEQGTRVRALTRKDNQQ